MNIKSPFKFNNLLLSFTESGTVIHSDELIYVSSNVTNLSFKESYFPRNKIFEQISLVFPFLEMHIYFESTSGEQVLFSKQDSNSDRTPFFAWNRRLLLNR